MKHALIIAHPAAKSFTATMAKAYAETLTRQGHVAIERDLYRMAFDPCLHAGEVPGPQGFEPASDVKCERALLEDVGAFAFFYPVWFNSPPAMLKGYVERVFGMGFGYGMVRGGNGPLLAGRSMISFSSSGAPKHWMMQTGCWDAMRKLFDEHFSSVCGLRVLDHLHFGGIVPNITDEAVEGCAAEVRAAAAKHFGQSVQDA